LFFLPAGPPAVFFLGRHVYIFLEQYSLFVAKILTLSIPVILIIRALARAKTRKHKSQDVSTSNLRFSDYTELVLANARALASTLSARGLKHRAAPTLGTERQTVFVLTIADEALAGRLSSLKMEVSAVLMAAHKDDVVLVRIKNRGGAVDAFGSAATQIGRLRNAGLRIVVSIDEVATSGGYLIATMAHEIIANPFACVGSIGLIVTQLNFAPLLERFGVSNATVSSGEHKLLMNSFSHNTDSGMQAQLDYLQGGLETWKALIGKQRPSARLEEITTGKMWFGAEAMKLGLIDRLQSFDEYVTEHFQRYHFLTVGTQQGNASAPWKNKVVQLMQRFV
jgi:serine protease SohB